MEIDDKDIAYSHPVGHGSLGDVYLAKHNLWGPVWIRRMNVMTTLLQASSTGHRLMKEAEVLKNLRHKNIVQMMGIIWNSATSHYAIVFEPARYGFLSEFLHSDKNKGLPISIKIAFMCDIALGLSYLHSSNVIHRDLRWQNIQVSEHFVMKIADFGLAEWISYSRSHSSARRFQGPTYHIAPESWNDINMRPNKHTDVYSYAILCWTIAAQEEPFKFASAEQVRLAVTTGQRPTFDNLPADCCSEFQQWLRNWWHMIPEERPPVPAIHAQLEEYVRVHSSIIETAKIQLHVKNQEHDLATDSDGGDEGTPSEHIETLGSSALERIMRPSNDLSGSDFGNGRNQTPFSAFEMLSQHSRNRETQSHNTVTAASDLEIDADESPDNTPSQDVPVSGVAQSAYSGHGLEYVSSAYASAGGVTLPTKETGHGPSATCFGGHSGLNTNQSQLPFQQEFNSAIPTRVYEKKNEVQKTQVYTFSAVGHLQIGDKNIMTINSPASNPSMHPAYSRKAKAVVKYTITSSKKRLNGPNMAMLEKELGKDWKILARKLDFVDGEIDAIEHDFQGLGEQIHQFLRQWVDKKDSEASLCSIADALIDIKKPEIAAKLNES